VTVLARDTVIRELRREDIATVYLHASTRILTLTVNDLPMPTPELALAAAAGHCAIPQPWVLPILRDALGLSSAGLAEWNQAADPIGAAFVMRALAHAIYDRDI
jgi:hypothetical protein